MARLCAESDDDELPDHADLLQLKPRAGPKSKPASPAKRATTATAFGGPSADKVEVSRNALNSRVVQASLRLQNSSEPRRQRPLKKISNNAVSLPSAFGTPTKSKEKLFDIPWQDDRLDTVRKTPSRRAKAAVKAVVLEVDEAESIDEGSESAYEEELSTASEGEQDSVIDIVSWRKPKAGPLKSPFQERLKAERRTKSSNESNRKTHPDALQPSNLFFTPILPPQQQNSRLPKPPSCPSSSEADRAAILTYNPPPKRTSPIKSPRKAPPPPSGVSSRPRTPSPPPSPTKSKLVSPSKTKAAYIPPTPHRPSIDAYWAPDVINAWNEQYSPRKTLTSPRKNRFVALDSEDEDYGERASSPSVSPRKAMSPPKSGKASPTKVDRAEKEAKKVFEERKNTIANEFLRELDEKICGGEIGRLSACTGGVKIVWSKKLNTTAGRAHWRRECLRTVDIESKEKRETKEYRHHCSIELASKVISTEHRLLNVIAHEFCHLATFMLSGVRTNPHGKEFRSWAAKLMSVFGESRGVEVTTKHAYEIEYKYVWECVECGCAYRRHSKSVDVGRSRCGVCKGRLVQTKPAPRGVNGKEDGKGGGEKKVSEYQRFVKEHFGRVKKENPGAGLGEVMEVLGRLYRERKTAAPSEEERMSRTEKAEKAEAVDVLVHELEVVTLGD